MRYTRGDILRRAYSFVRFSSPAQRLGWSKRRQVERSEKLCQQHGWLLDQSLDMLHVGSAFRGQHVTEGPLAAFLEGIRLGTVTKGSVLIVENLDRLSREEIPEALNLFMSIIKSGVDIATFAPERVYTLASIREPMGLMEPIWEFYRANRESARKSELIRDAWSKKRAIIKDKPLTSVCSAWVRIGKNGKGFEVIPERAAIVRRIFALAIDGYGKYSIAKILNGEGVPPMGVASHWCGSYIRSILSNRNVLGEFQPCERRPVKVKERDGIERTRIRAFPIPPVIKNYYPAVVNEKTYYLAQQTIRQRNRQKGRIGEDVTNLFAGIIYNALDDQKAYASVKRVTKPYFYLISAGKMRGTSASPFTLMRYDYFEKAVLKFLRELRVRDVVTSKQQTDKDEELANLMGKLAKLDHEIEDLKAKMTGDLAEDEDYADLFERKVRQKKNTAARLERVRGELMGNLGETLGETKTLAELLDKAEASDRRNLRVKIKSRIRSLVSEIWVLPIKEHRKTRAYVQVFLKSGISRYLIVEPNGESRLLHERQVKDLLRAQDLRNLGKLTDEDLDELREKG